jgi:hypothetical protein
MSERLRGEPDPIVSVLPDGMQEIYKTAAAAVQGLNISFYQEQDSAYIPGRTQPKEDMQLRQMFRLRGRNGSNYQDFWNNVTALTAAASQQEE